MSTQRSLYNDYQNKLKKPPSQINEEPYETEQNLERSKSQFNKKLSLTITPLNELKYQKIATTIKNLPEMPESAKNIAQTYIDNRLLSSDPGISNKIPTFTLKDDKHLESLGSKLLSGVRQIGHNNITGIQSQMSRNFVPSEQNNMNRSFSLKSLNNNLSSKATDRFNGIESNIFAPKMSARVKELTDEHFQSKDRSAQTLYNQHSTGSLSKIIQNGSQSGYLNLGSIKGFQKNIIITQSQTIPSNKLSPLPERYQQHVPNMIKKKISDATSTSFNFNPNVSGYNNNKNLKEISSLENLQSQLKQDVSYLAESKNAQALNLPTVLTTGNKAQDELLETTLGMKNMGKSLINLPHSIQELQDMLKAYENQNKQSSVMSRYENEERNLQKYLFDNFSSLDTIKEDADISQIQLPGLTLKQFKNNQQNQSKFLANQYSQQKSSKLQQSPFNLQDKHNLSPAITNLEKQSNLLQTTPEQLTMIENKIVKKFANQAFFGKTLDKSLDHKNNRREIQIQNQSLAIKESYQKPIPSKNMSTIHHKNPDSILNNAKFQSLQNSWLNDEKSQERNLIQDPKNTSLSPINIKTHKQISNNTLITQIVQSNNSGNNGNPSSRQDAILLIIWFEKMLLQVQQEYSKNVESGQDESKQFELLQLLMNVCVKELSRQVSVQCMERGMILQKVFQSYAKLIDLLNNHNKKKRWEHKREIADKLDRYINIQEGQINGFQDKIAHLRDNETIMKRDLEDCLIKLNQANILISKFKKKCWNAQKDLEVATRKLKYLERENGMLKQKVEDLSEKLGDELSEIDESDRRRMLLQIDEELADEKIAQLEKQDGEILDENLDIDQIPDREIIKEDDKATDMLDFERYLRSINEWNFQDNETQTDRVFKKHVKIGVKPEKLGILKDKETFIDARMFYGGKQSIQIRIGGAEQQQQHDSIKIEDQDQNLQEDDSEFYDSEDSDTLRVRGKLQDSSVDNDETLKELGLLNDQLYMQDKNDGFMSLDMTNLRAQRKTSLQADFDLNDLDQNNMKELPQYGTAQVDQILKKVNLETNNQRNGAEKHQRNVGIGNDSQDSSIKGYDEESKAQDLQAKRRQRKQKKENTLMKLFAERIKHRLKDLINSQDMEKIKSENEQFANLLISDLKNTQKEVKQMNNEIHKKDKQVRFQVKLNIKNEKDLKEAIEQIDQLEMDNYNMREQLNEIIRYFEEYEVSMQDMMKFLDRDSMGQMSIIELKTKLLALTDKILLAKQKSQQQLNDDDGVDTKTNAEIGRDGNINLDNITDDVSSSMNLTAQGFNSKGKYMMPNAQSRIMKKNKTSNLFVGQEKLDPKTLQEMIRKRQLTRFQMFNLGKRRKTPNKSKGAHPSSLILRKMQQKEVRKIKDIMPRKMLLRVIWQIYQERGSYDLTTLNQQQQPINIINYAANAQNQQAQNIQISNLNDKNQMVQTQNSFGGAVQAQNSQIPLGEWVYENFMQKYGLKNVAEKKFQQLIGSCILMKDQLPRIRLFGRFMEIYEDLSPTEYNRYLEITDLFQQQVLNFKIDDDLEIILLPLNRALDYFKLKFESKFTVSAFAQILQKVEKMRQPVGIEDSKIHKHLKNVKEAVDFDRYIEFILDTYLQLQEERENQIRDIYLASDLNGDGLISYSEFNMLMKVFLYKSQIDIQTLFDDYSSGDQDPQNKDSKYLNLEQFIQLCQEKEYFTTKVQQNFCQSKNIEKDFKSLTDTLPQTVLLFKARLREVNMHEDAESLELIENFQNCVKFPFSDKVGWLCYRIVDETLKRLFTKKLSDRYLPIDMKKLGFKIKPSQSLFGLIPLNLFDTL